VPKSLAHVPQLGFWEAAGEDVLALGGPLGSPSQLLTSTEAGNDINALLHVGHDPGTALDLQLDPPLDPWDSLLPPSPQPQCSSAAVLLMRFREDVVQHIASMDAYFSDPVQTLQGCQEEGAAAEAGNPAALLLNCSNEFIDIIQSLTPVSRHPLPKVFLPEFAPPTPEMRPEDALSTEMVLLALSGYLALMRLYDTVFHRIHQILCQMPPCSFKAVKVKSVLRVGGMSSLQDMPLKIYATGILDLIRSQMHTLERCMAVPTEYCLSDEAGTSHTAAVPGIFSRADRAGLFRIVMAQEDVQSQRSSKSHVQSIRENIRDSLALLDDHLDG